MAHSRPGAEAARKPLDPADPADALRELADALAPADYEVRVFTPAGRRPYLNIRAADGRQMTVNVFCDGAEFWWGWSQRISAADDIPAAVEGVSRAVEAVNGS